MDLILEKLKIQIEQCCPRQLGHLPKILRDWQLGQFKKKKKYGNFLTTNNRNITNASPVWKGLNICKETLLKGACKWIGNGLNTKVWLDPWIPKDVETNYHPISAPNRQINLDLLVADLMLSSPKRWNIHLLNTLFDLRTASNISSIKLTQEDVEDKFIWLLSKEGCHTIKDFYLTDQEHMFDYNNSQFWKSLW